MRRNWTHTLTTHLFSVRAVIAALAMAPAIAQAVNTVSPTNDTYTLGSETDLAFTLTPTNAATLVSITRDGSGSPLTPTTHYTVASETNVTIKSSYLENQSVDSDVTLTFNMSTNNPPTTVISIAAGDATISPTNGTHTLGTSTSLAITLTPNGNGLTNIHDGTGNLAEGAGNDYTVSGNTYTILPAYFNAQSTGTVNLAFQMDGGVYPTNVVTISAGAAAVDTETDDYDKAAGGNLEITLTPNGNTLSAINDGSGDLTETTDYTVSGDTYTILASYLGNQDIGDLTLTFQMSAGGDPTTVVTIVDDATVTPTGSHTLGTTNNVEVALNPNGHTLLAIKNGAASLALNTHYTVSNSTNYTIRASYLNAQAVGDLNLVFDMNGGVDPTNVVTILAGDATVSPTNRAHTLGGATGIAIALTPNGQTLSSISSDGTAIGVDDYTLSGNTYTILPAYLNAQAAGTTVTLTFNMDVGDNPTTAIAISAGNATVSSSFTTFEIGTPSDLVVTLTPNGRTFQSLSGGSPAITTDDYSAVGNVYTISNAYLNAQTAGTLILTFVMDAGTDPAATISMSAGSASATASPDEHPVGGVDDVVVITLVPNGRTLTNIKYGTTNLVAGTDYINNGDNTYTIKADFLNPLGVRDINLKFDMNGGTDPIVPVHIIEGDAEVTPTSSHTLGTLLNAPITLTRNGRTLDRITAAGSTLRTPEDFTVNGNVYTIRTAYLRTLTPTNDLPVVFDMSGGIDPTNLLTIVAGTPLVSPTNAPAHTLGASGDQRIVLYKYGRTLADPAVVSSGTVITTDDYTVDGDIYTISEEYLNKQTADAITLTFDFTDLAGGDTDPVVSIDINAGDASVTPEEATFVRQSSDNLVVTLTLNGRTLNAITYDGSTLVQTNGDYSVVNTDALNPVYTIPAAYLQAKGPGTYTLAFDMDEGTNPEVAVTVQPNTDAALITILGESDNNPAGIDGTSSDEPFVWIVNLDNSDTLLALSNVVVSADASKNVYTNSNFTGELTDTNTVDLSVGENDVYIKVTSEDTLEQNFYAVSLWRAPSTDATLVSVMGTNTSAVVGGTFAAPGTTSFEVNVTNSTLALADIVVADNATKRVYSDDSYSSFYEYSGPISLPQNESHVYIKVTAEDTSVVKYYDITIDRDTGSTVAELTQVLDVTADEAAIGNAAGGDSPANEITWAINASYTTADLTTADISSSNDLVSAVQLFSDDTYSTEENITLVPGETTNAYIIITAQDESVTNHYNVAITVSAGDNAGLDTVLSKTDGSPGAQSGADAGNAIAWEISVLYAIDTLTTNEIETSDITSTVELFTEDTFTTAGSVTLTQGVNNAYIIVTPQSGADDKRYYDVEITRQAPVADASLTSVLGLAVGDADVTPGDGTNAATRITWEFDDADIPFAVSEVTVTNIVVSDLATFVAYTNDNFTGNAFSGEGDTFALDPGGANSLYIKVLSEGDVYTNYYEVILSRHIGTTNALVVSVHGVSAIADGTFTGPDAGAPKQWNTIDLGYGVTNVTPTNIVVSTNATFELYSDADFTATASTIALEAGVETNIYILVTAQDINTPKVYNEVPILRSAGDTDAKLLSMLGVEFTYTGDVPASPNEGSGTFASPYELAFTVSNEVNSVALADLVVTNTASSMRLFDDAFLEESEATDTNEIALTVTPINTVYVWITAQDESVEKFYKIAITRDPSIVAGLYSVLDKTAADAVVGAQAGTSTNSAITWDITVPYDTLAVGTNDVRGAVASTVDVYTDGSFSNPVGTNQVDISMTATPIYIKVTSEDESLVQFYKVSISREGGLEVSPETLTYNAMTNYNPLTQMITVENSSTNQIDVAYVTEYGSSTNGWFTIDATTNFSLAAESTTNLSASVTATNLPVGTYYVTNTFTDGASVPWQVVVTLTLAETLEDTITISDLSQTYNGEGRSVNVSSLSGSTNISVTYDGESTIPTNAGTYRVVAQVAAGGSWLSSLATADLVVAKAEQVITIGNTNVAYNGQAKSVTTETTSGTEDVSITYDGGQDLPIEVGVYSVSATTLETANYATGIANATMTITKGAKGIINFTLPSSVQMGETLSLSADLAPAAFTTGTVIFAVDSGPGNIENATNLTFTGGGTVVVRAWSAAEDNFNAAPDVNASINVIDFAQDAGITNDFSTTHTGVHTLKFNDSGDLYLFYSSDLGGMNMSVQDAGTNVFGTNQLIGANSGSTLLRSPMDIQFGGTNLVVGQSGTVALLTDLTNSMLTSISNSAALGLRNSYHVAGTAPTNYLFVNSGASRVVAYTTTNNWATSTSKDIGAGLLSGAYAVGDTLAAFTSSGIMISTNAGATYATLSAKAQTVARAGERSWFAANLKTVNQNYGIGIEVYVNVDALDETAWRTGWSLVKTFEMGEETVSHIRVAAYESIAIVSWQQGSDGRMMYAVTQDHGDTWTDPVELISDPTYVRQSTVEAGYAIAASEKDESVRFVLAAGLDYGEIDLTPLALRATALTTNVYLRWDAPTSFGAPSDEVLIRVQSGTNAYPTLNDSGSQLYTGTDQLYIHDSVVADTTYFYQLWVKNGAGFVDPANFSGNKDIAMFEWTYASPSATVSPASTNYDLSAGGDLSFELIANGRGVTNITSLSSNDYEIVGNVCTIQESYLTGQSAGDTITLTFEMDGGTDPQASITFLADATINTLESTFQLGTSSDLEIELTPNGHEFVSIMNAESTLNVSNDYTVSGNTYTILADYLNDQPLGDFALEFVMDGGNNPTCVVTVVNNAALAPTAYRHTLGTNGTFAITLTDRGYAVTNIAGSTSLTVDDDYTVVSNVYSILPGYMDTLNVGNNTLTFNMDGGDDPTATILVLVGNATAEIATSSYTLGTAGTRAMTLTLNGREFNSLTDGSKLLIENTDYTTDGTNFTLAATYLDSLEPATVNLEFSMNAGIDPTVSLFVQAGNSVLDPVTDTYSTNAPAALAFELTRNGRALVKIRNTTAAANLTVDDYTIDWSNEQIPVYTISTNYLSTLNLGEYRLQFDMTGGTDPEAVITVAE